MEIDSKGNGAPKLTHMEKILLDDLVYERRNIIEEKISDKMICLTIYQNRWVWHVYILLARATEVTARQVARKALKS